MKGKTRNFIENISTLGLLSMVLYGGYYMIFKNNPQKEIEPTISEITAKVVKENTKKIIVKQDEVIEIKKIVGTKEKVEHITITTTPTITNDTVIKDKKKQLINQFLTTTKNNINDNIVQHLNLEPQNIDKYVKIRITILKDGNYEQLKYMGGNKQYFEFIKSDVVKIFPITMNEIIDDQFPRYFRMQVNN